MEEERERRGHQKDATFRSSRQARCCGEDRVDKRNLQCWSVRFRQQRERRRSAHEGFTLAGDDPTRFISILWVTVANVDCPSLPLSFIR